MRDFNSWTDPSFITDFKRMLPLPEEPSVCHWGQSPGQVWRPTPRIGGAKLAVSQVRPAVTGIIFFHQWKLNYFNLQTVKWKKKTWQMPKKVNEMRPIIFMLPCLIPDKICFKLREFDNKFSFFTWIGLDLKAADLQFYSIQ